MMPMKQKLLWLVWVVETFSKIVTTAKVTQISQITEPKNIL